MGRVCSIFFVVKTFSALKLRVGGTRNDVFVASLLQTFSGVIAAQRSKYYVCVCVCVCAPPFAYPL